MERSDDNSTMESKRRKTNRVALTSFVTAALILVSFFAGYFVRFAVEPAAARKITEMYGILRSGSVYYEDDADVTAKRFVYAVLYNDRYARYYSPREYAKVAAEDAGNHSGVGIAFYATGDSDVIAEVYLNSSAYKAGVRKDDRLVAGVFRGESAYRAFSDVLAEEIAGGAETSCLRVFSEFFTAFGADEEIRIKVERGGAELEFSFFKSDYTAVYVEYRDDGKYYSFSTEEDGFRAREKDEPYGNLSADTAYIKLNGFFGGAATQFSDALYYMRERGKTKLIIDLRDNGGGLLNVMSDIAAYLIDAGDGRELKVARINGKNAATDYYVSGKKYVGGITDISVIANVGTASASECLIGALNDYGDPVIYGGARFALDRLILTQADEDGVYRTYGKGIMQTTYLLRSGGAFVLTTAKIYWPKSDVCVQDAGIRTTDAANCVEDDAAIARANAVLHNA